ncbi:MAG: hypothetical protein ABSA70_02545 [Terriglobia bacterium]
MGHDLHSLLAAGPRLGTGTSPFGSISIIELARKNKKIVFLGPAKAGILLKTKDNLKKWHAECGWEMGRNEPKTARS